MSEARTKYVQAHEALLAHITETLKRDERFVAAWLAGSMEALAPDVVDLGGYVPASPR